ncbi:MAG: hypothetical protein IIV93_07195, partial [Clostridia bacterium]|nr:hypothetical protein [Clostridia bacterium]
EAGKTSVRQNIKRRGVSKAGNAVWEFSEGVARSEKCYRLAYLWFTSEKTLYYNDEIRITLPIYVR